MRYLIIPSVIVLFSVVFIWAALLLDESPPMIVGDSLQPRVFPILLMAINLFLAVLLALQYRRKGINSIPRGGLQTWGSVDLFAVFYPLSVYVDMMIAIAVVMFAMCYLWGERRLSVAGVIAVGTPTAIFFLFDLVLRVRFPRGLLTNWYYG